MMTVLLLWTALAIPVAILLGKHLRNMNINERLDTYVAARQDYDAKRRLASEAEEVRRRAESELVNAMLDAGTKSIGRDDGSLFSLRKNFSFSLTEANMQQAREWLLESEGDDSPFVKEVVSKPALTELLKKKMEDGIDALELPAFLKVNTMPGISVRGWKQLGNIDDNQEAE